MKFIATFICLLICGCGCASNPSAAITPPAPKIVARKPSTPLPPATTVTLTWQPNYNAELGTNEITFILANPDLAIPTMQWPAVFSGHTNTCTLPMIAPQMFFTATNALIQTTN